MNFKEDGVHTNLSLAEDMLNHIGEDPDLTEQNKDTVEMLIQSFSDDVTVLYDWKPLSNYHGGISLAPVGITCFHNAVKQSLNAVHVMKAGYKPKGVSCKRPQVFIITDGYSTDPKYDPQAVADAKKLCEKYVDTKKVALNVILLPGGAPDDALKLSDNVRLYKVDDCKYGLPAVGEFINASIVSFSDSAPGTDAVVPLPASIKTNQEVNTDSNGQRTVAEKVVKWN